MRHHISRCAAWVAVGPTLLAAVATFTPAPATAADEPQPVPPPAFVTPTPYAALPGYAGPYNIAQTYFVSSSDPDPYVAAGCASGDNTCLATPRDERPAPRPETAPTP